MALPAPQQSSDAIDSQQFDLYVQDVIAQLSTGSFRPALLECNHFIEQGIQDNFMHSRTAGGRAWQPRRQRTQTLEAGSEGTFDIENPLLILTSNLLQASTNKDHPDAVLEVTDRALNRGEDTEYGYRHNFGIGNMPQREYYDVPEDYLEECDEVIADHGLTFFAEV